MTDKQLKLTLCPDVPADCREDQVANLREFAERLLIQMRQSQTGFELMYVTIPDRFETRIQIKATFEPIRPPRGYLFESIDTSRDAVPFHRKSDLQVVEVSRRCEFIDLASSTRAMRRSGRSVESSTPPLRQLPQRTASSEQATLLKRVCLPFTPSFDTEINDRCRFLSFALSLQAPAVILVSVFPTTDTRQVDAAQASYLRERLPQIPSIATRNELESTYDRYLAPDLNVCSISTRIFSPSKSVAEAIAAEWICTSGGMRALQASPAKSWDAPLESTTGDDKYRLAHDRSADQTRNRRARIKQLLQSNRIASADADTINFIDGLVALYTTNEAATLLSLPFGVDAQVPGLDTRVIPPFDPSPPRPAFITASGKPVLTRSGTIRLGVISNEQIGMMTGPEAVKVGIPPNSHFLELPSDALKKGGVLIGEPGSGKSETARSLVIEAVNSGVITTTIEPSKPENFDKLRGKIESLACFDPLIRRHDGVMLLPMDLMRVPRHFPLSMHISQLQVLLNTGLRLPAHLQQYMKKFVSRYYTTSRSEGGCGFDPHYVGDETVVGDKDLIHPSWDGFGRFVDRYLDQEFAGQREKSLEWKAYFRQRMSNLSGGPLGRCTSMAQRLLQDNVYNPMEAVLSRPAIIELDSVRDEEDKALMMSAILASLAARVWVERSMPRVGNATRRMVVIEEAHRLLDPGGTTGNSAEYGLDPRTQVVEATVNMIAEFRADGVGVFLIEQLADRLAKAAVDLLQAKLVFRTTSGNNMDRLADAMLLDPVQRDFLARLGVGQAVVYSSTQTRPQLILMPGTNLNEIHLNPSL